MKRLLLTPIFKRFKKSAFFSSLNQNTCPVYDAEEIKKQEQEEVLISYIHKKRALSTPFLKARSSPSPSLSKIIALHMVFDCNISYFRWGCFFLFYLAI